MLRCAITDERYRRNDALRWAAADIDSIQLRAKSLEAGALAELSRRILADLADLGERPHSPKLLINGRADVALASGAAGVHLTAREDELTPDHIRRVFAHAGAATPLVSISCHTLEEVRRARDNGADIILFGPVFEKRIAGELVSEGVGLEQLQRACALAGETPVLALGGVTAANTAACLSAGASGIAGIRLFA